jgi:hypothetical protein
VPGGPGIVLYPEEFSMTQPQLDRSVARTTGESPRPVRRLGLSALPDGTARPHPEALYLVIDSPCCNERSPFPGQRADGTCPPAECRRCEARFAFDLLDVYIAASVRG